MEAPIYENHILKFTFNSKSVSAQEVLVASSRFKASVSSHCHRVPLAFYPPKSILSFHSCNDPLAREVYCNKLPLMAKHSCLLDLPKRRARRDRWTDQPPRLVASSPGAERDWSS